MYVCVPIVLTMILLHFAPRPSSAGWLVTALRDPDYRSLTLRVTPDYSVTYGWVRLPGTHSHSRRG